MADAQLPAKPKRIPGLPNNFQLLTFDGFDGLNTKPTRAGLKDQQCFVLDNFMPLGKSNVRTLYDVGGAIAHIDSTGQIQPGPAPVTTLSFTVQPGQFGCGGALDLTDVTASDLTFSGNVTIALGTNPTGATLSGTLTQPAFAGVAVFDDLSLNKQGTGYTLVATAPGFSSATSNAFSTIQGKFAVCLSQAGAFAQNLDNTAASNLPSNSHFGLLLSWSNAGVNFFGSTNGVADRLQFTTANGAPSSQRLLLLSDSSAASILQIDGLSLGQGSGWHVDVVSFDTLTQTLQWIRDGSDITGTLTVAWSSTNVVPYSLLQQWFLQTGRSGDVSDCYFWVPGSYVSAATAYAAATSGGNPVALGDGSSVTGAAAFIGLHGDNTTYVNNLGNGGAWAVDNPPLLSALTSPWP